MYWRHVVASTLPEREEFVAEGVNNSAYASKHSRMIFEEGFSFSGFERDKFWLNTPDGRWFDVSNISGADDDNDGRALCLADFDDDGDLDFFVHNTQRERHRLYRNDVGSQSGNGWIKLRLGATAGHASAAGAIVRAHLPGRTQAKVLSLGSGFLSQNASELVFGLGDAPSAEISVRWPGRAEESFGPIAAGSRVRLIEGTGEAQPYEARRFAFPDPAQPGLELRLGDRVPSLPLVRPDGEATSVEMEGGDRPVLVNFWASYCVSCVAELPDLQELHDAGEWRVILVGMDHAEDRARAEALLEQRGVTLEHYYYSDALIAEHLDPDRMPLPTSLFLDDGTLREVLQAPIHDWSGWKAED